MMQVNKCHIVTTAYAQFIHGAEYFAVAYLVKNFVVPQSFTADNGMSILKYLQYSAGSSFRIATTSPLFRRAARLYRAVMLLSTLRATVIVRIELLKQRT